MKDIIFYKICLIRIKWYAALAINHLDTVEGEHLKRGELPDDQDFNQILWTLLSGIDRQVQWLSPESFPLPGVDTIESNDETKTTEPTPGNVSIPLYDSEEEG